MSSSVKSLTTALHLGGGGGLPNFNGVPVKKSSCLPSWQVFANEVEGVSLFERIKRDKQHNIDNNKHNQIVMGKTYYAALRALYLPATSISRQVAPSNPLGEASPVFRKGMIAWKRGGDRLPIKMFLQSATKLTENEVSASLRWLDSLNPSGLGDQLQCCVVVMEALVRTGSDVTYAGWMDVCKAKFQSVLLQAGLSHRLSLSICNPISTSNVCRAP